MIKPRLLATAFLLGSVLVAGCTSTTTKTSEYSGFLSDYSNLTPAKSASGEDVLRWQDPSFKLSNYGEIVFQPPQFYPAPLPNERVNEATLQKVLDYIKTQVGGALRYRLTEAQKPGPGKLTLRGAVTGVSAADQGLKPYEVVPFAMVAAAAQSATGHRTQYATMFVEAEIIDADTGKPVVKTVRKVMGKTVNNAQQNITFEDLKVAIDNLAQDIRTFK